MEKDDEIFEGGYGAEFWEYDARLGRRWNLDPVVKPWESGYATFSNNPIYYIDPSGDDPSGPGDKGAFYPTPDGKAPDNTPFYPTPDGSHPGSKFKRIDEETFGQELREAVIVRDKTNVNPEGNGGPVVHRGYLEAIWNNITSSVSIAINAVDGLLSWRGGFPLGSSGSSDEIREAPLGKGQPGNAILNKEGIDVWYSGSKGNLMKPQRNRPKPEKSVPEDKLPGPVGQAAGVNHHDPVLRRADEDSVPLTIHRAKHNGGDTTYKISKRHADSLTHDGIFRKK